MIHTKMETMKFLKFQGGRSWDATCGNSVSADMIKCVNESTSCHNSEDYNLHNHPYENLKTCKAKVVHMHNEFNTTPR
jgi:ribulose-5-phosphate 4-epimerase/fuculose-1-phosphate aldolase